MGASKYTDAQRVTVLGLYVENIPLPGIVARTGLDRQSVTNIMQTMLSRARRRCSRRDYYLEQKMRRIHDAEPGLPSPRT